MAQESTQTLITKSAPYEEEFRADIFAGAKALTGDGTMMPYSAKEIAALSPAQQEAIKLGQSGIGGYEDYLTSGADTINQGIGAVDTGLDLMGSAADQLPGAKAFYQDQSDAAALATGQGQAGLGEAQDMTSAANYDFGADSYKQYMDPYMDDVIQQQYKDIQRLGDVQKQSANSQAVGAGAFGGSRQGVQQASIDRNILDQQAKTGSQLRSAGFKQASDMAQTAAANVAQQQLLQAGQYGDQSLEAGNLGLTGAKQQGDVGAGIGNLIKTEGQLGASTVAAGDTLSGMGTATAGIGTLDQTMGVQDINTLMGVGALDQGQTQAELDAEQANDLALQNLPFDAVGFQSDVLTGVPSMNQTIQTNVTPDPSKISQITGLAQAGYAASQL
tara:strand:+ start:980 stop:2143 length:1164 start_codon:yes stop_codon:yes gene_type:complete